MKKNIISLAVLVLGFSAAAGAGNRNRHIKALQGSVSQQNIVKTCRYMWNNGFLAEKNSYDSSIDTLRVFAMRVAFQPDTDTGTTGNGMFDLSVPETPVIDPGPHDRAYFEYQLEAVKNYFSHVSAGRLVITYDVAEDIVTVPDTMAVYATSPADTGLVRLVEDAVNAGDKAGYDFSQYDVYVVYHAGVGRDIQLSYDPTPQDIPSAFLSIEDIQGVKGSGFEGFAVQNGAHHITECIILPETESQEGYEIGLLGTSTLLFGFQIGIPALWDTRTNRSGIGRWGLMDQGSGNFSGLLPAEPSAWTKVFMGWQDPVSAGPGESVSVTSSLTAGKGSIFKVMLNDHEYFLIENRQSDANGDSVALGTTSSGGQAVFNRDGTISLSGDNSVITSVDEYDFDLPGSGILIWHIDESIIARGIADNEINIDRNHRGVDLEEADGAQDIGQVYGFISGGAGSEYGVMHDAFYRDNEINKLVNDRDVVEFTPESFPSTDSYSGGATHLVITDFSNPDTVMTCSIESSIDQQGFPVRFGSSFTPMGVVKAGIGEENLLLVPVESGKVFCWNSDGSPGSAHSVYVQEQSPMGRVAGFSVPCCIDVNAAFTCMPAVVVPSRDDARYIACAFSGGNTVVYSCTDNDGDGMFDIMFQKQESSDITFLCAIDTFIYAGTASGNVITFSLSGEKVADTQLCQDRVVVITRYSEFQICAVQENGTVSVIDENGIVSAQFVCDIDSGLQGAAVTRIEKDGEAVITVTSAGSVHTMSGTVLPRGNAGPERMSQGLTAPAAGYFSEQGETVIAVTGPGTAWALDDNCSFTDYFPVFLNQENSGMSSPVMGDVDGDGLPEIVCTSESGLVYAVSGQGLVIDGFPLTTGSGLAVTPLLADIDLDGDTDILAVSRGGWLYAWDVPGVWSERGCPWPALFHDASHTGYMERPSKSIDYAGTLMPAEKVYNYPNPVEGTNTVIRYWLDQDAEVTIDIIDLNGVQVDSFSGPGRGLANNEVVWNVEKISSGVYFCRVTATGGGTEKTATITVAVAK